MSNVVDLPAHIRLLAQLTKGEDNARERFLLDEGLDLLANFRAIENDEKRLAISNFVRNVALAENRVEVDPSI